VAFKDISKTPRERARVRKAVREYVRRNGQPRDRKREWGDTYEKTAWLAAQKLAIDLQARLDGLVSREWAQRKLAEISKRVEERLLAIPRKVASEIAAEPDPAKVRRLLEDAIARARRELADELERVG
jgi:hypothetical protein